VLTVDYLPRTAPPALPRVLDGWVDSDSIHDPAGGEPRLAEEGPTEVLTTDETGSTSHVATVPGRPAAEATNAYEQWLSNWRQWAETELTARPRRDLYERLARIARVLSQQDEIYEVVLGLGLLTWRDTQGQLVSRHLVTTRLGIWIDRNTAQLTVALAPEAHARLEDRDFLDEQDGFAGDRTMRIREQLSADAPHPLSEDMAALLEQWQAFAFNHPVRYEHAWEKPNTAETTPHLSLTPALLLRERDRNALAEYYDRILASLTGTDVVSPLGLAQLLFALEEEERLAWPSGRGSTTDKVLGDDPLFPLPTNPAQRAVLDRLQQDTAVVVQGPPGTGKTHTIANLVSALLATGQRVLVTSQKDQALKVLRDKLPTPVRDLCVLLTDIQRGGSEELERSITALSDRTATSDPQRIRHNIARLGRNRADLRSRCARILEDVRALREAETYKHPEVAPGYGGTLADIVETVMARRSRYDWMPNMPEGAPATPPLTAAEALELHSLLATATPTRTTRRDELLPSLQELPSADQVADAVAIILKAADELSGNPDPLLHALAGIDEQTSIQIDAHLNDADNALHQLALPIEAAGRNPADWRTRALTDRLARQNGFLWKHMAASADHIRSTQDALIRRGSDHVQIPDITSDEAASMIDTGGRLWAHLAKGGKLRQRLPSPLQRAAQPLLTTCTVNGHQPMTAEDVRAIVAYLQAHVTADDLTHRWAEIGVADEGGPLLGRLSRLADRAGALQHVAVVGAARDAVDSLLMSRGIRVLLNTPQQWDDFHKSMKAARDGIAATRATQSLAQMEQRLAQMAEGGDPIREVVAAKQAIRVRDLAAYKTALAALREAHREQAKQRACDALLERLRQAHPLLADHLTRTIAEPQWEERLAELPAAWAWGRARAFCERRHAPDLDQRLQGELDATEQRLTQVTAELAAEHAWLFCLTRMTQEQRAALQAYKSSMGALGKGKGRYAPRYRRAARDAMSLAQKAVPAWVMPLPQVVETIPPEPDSFDVVIVDEASQVGIDSLFLLWLAPRVIVVGDDKQCAPAQTTYGELQRIFDRLDSYLPDVPTAFRDGFAPQSNLYELLSTHFPKVVRLTEHFRCMPEIIGWSSAQFYDRRLVPLRQFGADRLDPLRVEFVEGAYTEGRDAGIRNPVEAKQIVEKLQEILEDPEYRHKTIAIIVLQGYGQARLIEDLVTASIDPAEREQRRIRVGTPPDFQGDQRDVVLLSMVVTAPGRALGTREEQRKFNVGASRARDQMWLFTSMKPDQLRPKDLRRSLLTYMQAPPPWQEPIPIPDDVPEDTRHSAFDSLFEQRVFLRLRRRGYHVIPQFPVNGRRIDLVVVGANGRLAVECDGRSWHTSPEQVRDDLERERELRRVGWRFWRVRESEFYFDPQRALASLWKELERRGIEPGVVAGSTAEPATTTWNPVALPETDDEAGLDTDER
jgi:very-short-patch-repair endonuclease